MCDMDCRLAINSFVKMFNNKVYFSLGTMSFGAVGTAKY